MEEKRPVIQGGVMVEQKRNETKIIWVFMRTANSIKHNKMKSWVWSKKQIMTKQLEILKMEAADKRGMEK